MILCIARLTSAVRVSDGWPYDAVAPSRFPAMGRVGSTRGWFVRYPARLMWRRRLLPLVLLVCLQQAAAPSTVAAPALPDCRYTDVWTRFRTYDRWRVTFLDTIYRVGRTYDPPGLRYADTSAGVPGHRLVRDIVVYGYAKAITQSARPGHSEHQLGTTLDFRSYGNSTPPWEYADWGTTAAGRWLAANAWRYGFVMSYPKGKMKVTCYTYEPWHYRYVGRPMAARVRESGLTLREYLWRTSESIR
jgi:zinc D-Ala-D-Ala carboxypeptidase